MVNDLQVAGIHLPVPVVGACSAIVKVDVINAGPDAAVFPSGMTVCLDIRTSSDGPPDSHYTVSILPEAPPIDAGKVRTFVFRNVQFPCRPSASIKATADCTASVPDNQRTADSLTLAIPKIDFVPWLWTTVRLGLEDSTGRITWDPGALCPSATCVVEASIRNAGCAAAVPSVTSMELVDGAGQVITSMTQNTPAIAPGGVRVVRFTTALPAAAPSGIKARACADSTGVVVPQCDLSNACAETAILPFATAAGPQLTFAATRAIFPGEPVPLMWRIANVCSDIGAATARISYQGTVLYTSVPIPVGLMEPEKGEDPTVGIAAAVAASFYKIGTSTLTVDITGTGNDPGPYTTTAAVTVSPEPSSGTWAFTTPVPGTPLPVPWKGSYTVAGRLTNPARATMTPSSLVLNESSLTAGALTLNASPPMGAIVPGAFGATVWPLRQAWSWVVPGVWLQTGPWMDIFTYTTTFSMQDAFGNAYPATTSSAGSVYVSVAGYKIGLAAAAYTCFCVGVGLVISGFIALAGYITAIGAPALFAAAGAAFAIATGLGAGALDPPVPDFEYRTVVVVRRASVPSELPEAAPLAPILQVLELLARISGMTEAMNATEARLAAARIDRDQPAIDLQAGEYRALRDRLLAAAESLPQSAFEAGDQLQTEPLSGGLASGRAIKRTVADWTKGGLPPELRKAWLANGRSADELKRIQEALQTKGFSMRSFDDLLRELEQAAAQIAAGVREESEAVLGASSGGLNPGAAEPEAPTG